MDILKLKTFFMWCTIINGALLVFGIVACLLGPSLWHGVHSRLFHISSDNLSFALYLFLGLYKIIWIVFNVVPYAALRIIANKKHAG